MNENTSMANVANKTLFYLVCLDIAKIAISGIGTINTADTTKTMNAIYNATATSANAVNK